MDEDEIKKFGWACMGLTKANLNYVFAVASALKFSEESDKSKHLDSAPTLQEEVGLQGSDV